MARRFGSLDLVQLPRLDGISAQTLGTEVLAAAKGKSLPEAVEEALNDLSSSYRALQKAAVERLPTTTSADPARTKRADTALDASWSSLFDFLTGWSKLPDHPSAARASDLIAQIFPEGLKFVLLAYKLEWAESALRLRLMTDRELGADIEALGGAPILKRLRDAHKEYGEALGVTTVTPADLATTSLREALDEFCEALRHYIVRVAASVRKKDNKTAELALALLAPIENWKGPGGGIEAGETPPPVPPAAPPVPTPAA